MTNQLSWKYEHKSVVLSVFANLFFFPLVFCENQEKKKTIIVYRSELNNRANFFSPFKKGFLNRINYLIDILSRKILCW